MSVKNFPVEALRTLGFDDEAECGEYILNTVHVQELRESRWHNIRRLVFSATHIATGVVKLWRTPEYRIGKTESIEHEIFEKWDYSDSEVPCTEVSEVERTITVIDYYEVE